MALCISVFFTAAAFVAGFFVGRNNPNLEAVNNLVAAGKAIIDESGKLIKKVK